MLSFERIFMLLVFIVFTTMILTFVTKNLYVLAPLCILIWVLSIWLLLKNRKNKQG